MQKCENRCSAHVVTHFSYNSILFLNVFILDQNQKVSAIASLVTCDNIRYHTLQQELQQEETV